MILLKSKALFMLIVLVSSIFSISLLNVNQVNAQEQRACCEINKNREYCVYTDANNCATNSRQNFATCEQTSYCKIGSCFVESQGKCFKNVGRATCGAQNGTFFDTPGCNIPLAKEGCCVIGDESFFTTQGRCKIETSKFPNVEMSFDESIKTESECLQKSFSEDLGACVKEDGTCSFTTQQLCNEASKEANGVQVGFHKGVLCSNPTLGTECAKQQTTKCIGEDVFWFDSCGNKENVYSSNKVLSYNNGFLLTDEQSDGICTANINDPDCGNCDYASGTICGKVVGQKPKFGDFVCKSTSCDATTNSPSSPSAGTPKKAGESWCLYDGAVGEGRDLVGSRHFRAVCINGEEIVEPCKDFREELCFQDTIKDESLTNVNIQQGFTESACRFNRWESCTACNAEELCGGECDGLEDPFKDTEVNEAQAFCCAKKCCQDSAARDCHWSQTGISALPLPTETLNKLRQQDIAGVCVPDVPPGIKFWSDETKFVESTTRGEAANIRTSSFSPDASETVCEDANIECTVKWRRGGSSRLLGRDAGWKVIQNEHCTKPEWVIAGNNLCKSLGDCGAYFNIAGDSTFDGYTNTASSEREKDGLFFNGYKLQKKDLGDFKLLTSADVNEGIPSKWNYFLPGGVIALAALTGLGITTKILGGWTVNLLKIPFAKFGFKTLFVKGLAKDAAAGISKTGIKVSATSVKIFAIANVALWAYTIYSLVDVIFGQEKEKTYQIGCGLWQPPEKGSKCELCNQDPKRPCSEYRCKSLGQQCSLVNQGTSDEKCISVNQNDANSPKINPWRDIIKNQITVDGNNGYKLNQEVPPFTPVTLGIQTNEPAQCRFDKDLRKRYDDMVAFFGGQLYVTNHSITINLPSELAEEQALRLTKGGEHTLYLKCKDSAGNRNERDYYIKFKVKPGPDLTPPRIEETSPLNGALIRNDVNKTSVSVFVNEPAECKWGKNDVDFNLMQKSFACQTSGFVTSALRYGLYECATEIGNLTLGQNKFFFKCKDQPGKNEQDRNVMQQSLEYTLTRTSGLSITSASPSGTLFNGNVTLRVSTANGAENGKALCAFNTVDTQFSNMIEFANTNSNVHEQSLILNTGSYNYFVVCRDIAGNEAKSKTSFNVAVDLSAPNILRIYSTASNLNIELDEEVDCEFSDSSFVFGNGTLMTKSAGVHSASIANRLNIICEDVFNNKLGFVVYP